MLPEQNKRLFGSTPIIGDYMPYTTIRIPMNDKDGNAMYWDYARWVPGGDIFEQRESKGQVPGVPSPLQPGGLWWDALSNFVFKTDPFTGQDLKDLGVDEEDSWELFKHFLGRIPPYFFAIPGTFANKKWRKAKAIERGEEGSEYVKETTPWLAIAYGLGLKLRPQNPDINRALRLKLFEREVSTIRGKLTKMDRDYSDYGFEFFGSQEKFDKEYQNIEEELIRVVAEYELWQQKVGEIERQFSREYKSREKKVKGGLIEGEDKVPFTKENPADRINKFTGEPYQEQMNRLGFNDGGSPSELPRGIRNNNPFNLAIGAVDPENQNFVPYNRVAAYNGVIGTDSVGIGTIKESGDRQLEAYPIFTNQELGNRAGMHNLLDKYNNKTVDEIFSKYSRTDRDTYAKNIGLLTGLDRNTKLDIRNNPELAAELARGLIILENGLTKDNQNTHLIPSRQALIQAHIDAQEEKEDSEYSKTKWNTDKGDLQKTLSKVFT